MTQLIVQKILHLVMLTLGILIGIFELRGPVKRWSCTPIQRLKLKVHARFGDAFLYGLLCSFETFTIIFGPVVNVYHIKHRSAAGIILHETWAYNAMYNQGEYDILDVFFRNGAPPVNFQLGLCYDSPTASDVPADIMGEPGAGIGYTRGSITRDNTGFPSLAMDAGHYKITTKAIVIGPATSIIGPVNHMFLITTNAPPRLVAFVPLVPIRTLQVGEDVTVDMYFKPLAAPTS